MATRVKKSMPVEGAEVAPSTSLRRVRKEQATANPANEQAGNSYFADSSLRTELEFFSSGCLLLDQVMGGGYVLGRMSNMVGDKSTGKTLLMIEATVNFLQKYSDGYIRYAEAESAFDKPYAAALGMPVDRIDWADFRGKKPKKGKASRDESENTETPEEDEGSDRTVEYVFEDIKRVIAKLKGRPGLYIIDSLDALSDRTELATADGDSKGFGMQKAKALHELFRRLVGDMERSRMTLLIVSQIKDKINAVAFGETKMRTGGHAMDFFATHVVWLAQTETVKKTINGVTRPVSLSIKAKCKKNKVGLPLRECEFPLIFGYGIDDVTANIEWLIDVGLDKLLADVDMSKAGYKLRVQKLRDADDPTELQHVRRTLNQIVMREWARIEQGFLPKQRKY